MSKKSAETYVVLLRGINVGGHNKLKMADLKSSLAALKYQTVQTYLQSGNIVLTTGKTDPEKISSAISRNIKRTFGFDVPVHDIVARQWERIANGNPLLKKNQSNIKELHVTFCHTAPDKKLIGALKVPAGVKDSFSFGKQECYVRCTDGYGKSKLTNSFFEKQLSVACTSRNWKTVIALQKLIAKI